MLKHLEEWNKHKTPDIEGVYYNFDDQTIVVGVKIPMEILQDIDNEQSRLDLMSAISRVFGWLESTIKLLRSK